MKEWTPPHDMHYDFLYGRSESLSLGSRLISKQHIVRTSGESRRPNEKASPGQRALENVIMMMPLPGGYLSVCKNKENPPTAL